MGEHIYDRNSFTLRAFERRTLCNVCHAALLQIVRHLVLNVRTVPIASLARGSERRGNGLSQESPRKHAKVDGQVHGIQPKRQDWT